MTQSNMHPHVDMPPEDELSRLVEGKSLVVREVYLEAHRLVLEAVPDVQYAVDAVDGQIGYGARQYGYDGWGMAALSPYKNWVSLGFLRGVALDDPEGLLEGSGASVRHVKLRSTDQIEAKRGAIKRLLEDAARLNLK